MNRKQILLKIAVASVLFTVCAIILSNLVTSADAIVSNYLALGQLENDNSTWLFMQMYTNIGKPISAIIAFVISSAYIVYLIYNVIKYHNYSKEIKNNEKTF